VNKYSPEIYKRAVSPINAGSVEKPNGVGTAASFVCGSFIRFSMQICGEGQVVDSVRFQTNGCGYMIGAADVIADWIQGQRLKDLHGFDENELTDRIVRELGFFPKERNQCSDVAVEALRTALADHRRRMIEEFRGEKALICTCFGVSEDTIVRVIEDNVLTEVEEVSDACRAGAGCGSCQFMIRELIDAVQVERS
jgi:NifU-like protein